MEVERGVVLDGDAGEQLERRLERVDEVGARRRQVGRARRRELAPARAVDRRRVVPGVGLGNDRRQARMRRIGALAARALHVAGDPVLLEPADVAERPERRVELGGERRGRDRPATRAPRRRPPPRARSPSAGCGCARRSGRARAAPCRPSAGSRCRGRTRRTRSRRRRGGRAGAAVERQEARRHVRLVEALARPSCSAARRCRTPTRRERCARPRSRRDAGSAPCPGSRRWRGCRR